MLCIVSLAPHSCTLDRLMPRRELLEGEPNILSYHQGTDSWVYSSKPKTAANAADQHATWDGKYPLCRGLEQSPININTEEAVSTPALDRALEPRLLTHVPLLVNTGVYFELDLTTPVHYARPTSADKVVADEASKGTSRIEGGTYNFYQARAAIPPNPTLSTVCPSPFDRRHRYDPMGKHVRCASTGALAHTFREYGRWGAISARGSVARFERFTQ
jgi:hypothetical protein